MKALVQDRYGSADVLAVRELPTPELNAGQVLVRVRAASVNALDWHTMRGQPSFIRLVGEGLRRPKTETRGADLTTNAIAEAANRLDEVRRVA